MSGFGFPWAFQATVSLETLKRHKSLIGLNSPTRLNTYEVIQYFRYILGTAIVISEIQEYRGLSIRKSITKLIFSGDGRHNLLLLKQRN